MYGNQPDTQMLVLWACHRRKLVCTESPAHAGSTAALVTFLSALALALFLTAAFLAATP